MDIVSGSEEQEKQLQIILEKLVTLKSEEDSHVEYKTSALSSQSMKDNLVRTVTAFLNSKDGGCFIIGIAENEKKAPVFLGLEKTEKKKDDEGRETGKVTFKNRDDYNQTIFHYIADNIDNGSDRINENIRLKWNTEYGVTICALFIKPYVLGPNQIPAFARIFEKTENYRKKEFKEVFYLRQSNYTKELNIMQVAKLTASNREGNLSNPADVTRDTPSDTPTIISDAYTLIAVDSDAVTSKGQPMLEITLQKDGRIRKMKRYNSMGNAEKVANQAKQLIGRKVRTTTWGNDKTPPERYEELNFFNYIYPALEKQTF